MAKFIEYSCPNCKASLSNGYRRTVLKAGMGIPFTKCLNCLYLIRTGWKPFSQLSLASKILYWLGALFTSLIYGTMIGFILTSLLYLAIDRWIFKINDENTLWWLFLPLPILFVAWQLYTFYANIGIVEDHYNREDWSLEM
ncbi:hypothetical protein [Hymenobacter jejuensis]|uniref:Uncharacterized protein n=1 Tax=Hymenobacter jejuensis TaxID=2502781 RepID=A0A5B7ZZ38_9BACT|nr:hypothetical protein [Hymenobacter jejuensis]QDA60260.1 hypothetical protein FHG12_09105 [Hymenobacter jejuensis]